MLFILAFPLSFGQYSSVTQLCMTLCNPCSMPSFPVHYQLPELSNSCPSSQWCHPTILSSVVPFSSHLQSFPASGSFPMSQLFASGGQSIGASVSASVFPKYIQDWFRTDWLDLLTEGLFFFFFFFLNFKFYFIFRLYITEGLLRVFSNTTVQKNQFFGAQLSLWSNSHIHIWLLEKP